MKKPDLTAQMARESKTTKAAAADDVHQIVHELLDRLRKGYSAELPGVGTFTRELNGKLGFQAPVRRKSKERKS